MRLAPASTSDSLLVDFDVDGRPRAVSDGLCERLGRPRAELLASGAPLSWLRTAETGGGTLAWALGPRAVSLECDLLRCDGTPVRASVTVSPARGIGGRLVGWTATMRPHGDDARPETIDAAARAAEQALEAGGAAVWEWRPAQGFTWWSGGLHAMHGVARTLGPHEAAEWPHEHVHPEDRATLEAGLEMARRGRGYRVEYRVRWPDGSEHWIETSASPVRTQAGEQVMSGVSRLCDERKALEVERAAHDHQQRAIARLTECVAGGGSLRSLADLGAELAAELVRGDAALVVAFGAARAYPVGSWSIDRAHWPARAVLEEDPALVRARTAARPSRVGEYGADDGTTATARWAAAQGWSSSVSAPILVDGAPWGAVHVLGAAPWAFAAAAEDPLSRLAGVLGLTLAGAEAFPAHGGEGAPVGRAAVLARLEDAVAEARSSGDPLSLVALAVDPWAEEGVLRGGADADRLLRGVGAAIAREPGRGRWVGRVDGDVLLAALPGLDGTSAHAVAERLRLAAAAAAPRGRRRASAGICDATRAGSADQLLTLALSALAWAAAHGRDRTVIYSPETVGRAPDENRSRADGETHPLRRTG